MFFFFYFNLSLLNPPCLSEQPAVTACIGLSLSESIMGLTSAEKLQVANFFSDLQLEDLLEDLLPQRLLHDSHPLQLLAIQAQQGSPCQKKDWTIENILNDLLVIVMTFGFMLATLYKSYMHVHDATHSNVTV